MRLAGFVKPSLLGRIPSERMSGRSWKVATPPLEAFDRLRAISFAEKKESRYEENIHVVFMWDEKKNRINRRKHGIWFKTAARIFEDPNVVSYRDRVVDEEERWHAIGSAGGIAIVLVVHDK